VTNIFFKSFENGLKCVTAEYKIVDSTKLTVINGGIKIKYVNFFI